MRPFFILLAVAASAAVGCAGPKSAAELRPDVDGMRLRLATDTLMITKITDGQETPDGLAISILRSSGPDQLEMTYRWLPNTGDSATIIARLDRRSLRPVAEERRYPDGSVVRLAYDSSGVRSDTSRPGHGSQSHPADAAAHDAYTSTTVDLVLRALPLTNGFKAQLPVHFSGALGRQSLPVRVVGAEMIRTRAGATLECWLVEGDFPGPATERFWIAKDTHDLIRVLSQIAPNAFHRYDR